MKSIESREFYELMQAYRFADRDSLNPQDAVNAYKAVIAHIDAVDAGKDATGLCTVHEAVSEMIKMKSDRMEMLYWHVGETINVELLITSRRPSWLDGGYDFAGERKN